MTDHVTCAVCGQPMRTWEGMATNGVWKHFQSWGCEPSPAAEENPG